MDVGFDFLACKKGLMLHMEKGELVLRMHGVSQSHASSFHPFCPTFACAFRSFALSDMQAAAAMEALCVSWSM